MTTALQSLITQAEAALKGKAPWGHTLSVDVGADGALYVCADNSIIEGLYSGADCTLHFPKGIISLQNLEDKDETAMQEWWDSELTYDGDRSIAEQFVSLIQSAK